MPPTIANRSSRVVSATTVADVNTDLSMVQKYIRTGNCDATVAWTTASHVD
jgi:hypothetical protein